MNQVETNRFNELYQRHLRMLNLQGKSQKTIDAYARAVRRISEQFDCGPDQLTLEQREKYFSELVESHSWSTVKIDRNGLQFFWQHVLKQDWQWVNIVKAPEVRSLPDILTVTEVEQLIAATRKLRYRVFLLATYSMGLRLSETLALQVGDIDGKRKRVHIRLGKFHNRLLAFQGVQRNLGLECRCMIPSGSFAHTMSLLGFIVEQFVHLCTCPVLPDQLWQPQHIVMRRF